MIDFHLASFAIGVAVGGLSVAAGSLLAARIWGEPLIEDDSPRTMCLVSPWTDEDAEVLREAIERVDRRRQEKAE